MRKLQQRPLKWVCQIGNTDRHLLLLCSFQSVRATYLNTTVEVLIDSGANGNFISRRFLQKLQLQAVPKKRPYQIQAVNGTDITNNGLVSQETEELLMTHDRHIETITLDVLDDISQDVILGMPWLKKHNPDIQWNRDQIVFRCQCVGRKSKTVSATKLRAESKRTGQGLRTLWYQVNACINKESTNLPKKYAQFEDLGKDDLEITALPKHKPWDHTIPLQEGKSPTYGPIYALNQNEMEELRKYIDENQKKGFIRPSSSPAGYPIIFVPKKRTER